MVASRTASDTWIDCRFCSMDDETYTSKVWVPRVYKSNNNNDDDIPRAGSSAIARGLSPPEGRAWYSVPACSSQTANDWASRSLRRAPTSAACFPSLQSLHKQIQDRKAGDRSTLALVCTAPHTEARKEVLLSLDLVNLRKFLNSIRVPHSCKLAHWPVSRVHTIRCVLVAIRTPSIEIVNSVEAATTLHSHRSNVHHHEPSSPHRSYAREYLPDQRIDRDIGCLVQHPFVQWNLGRYSTLRSQRTSSIS